MKYIQEVLTLVCADASRGDVVPRRFSESSHKSDTRTSPDKKELKMMYLLMGATETLAEDYWRKKIFHRMKHFAQ